MQAFGELENSEINWERVAPFYIMEDTLNRAAVIIVLVDANNNFYYQYATLSSWNTDSITGYPIHRK